MRNNSLNKCIYSLLIYPMWMTVFLFFMSGTTFSQEVKSKDQVLSEVRYQGVTIQNVKIDVIGTVIIQKGTETKVEIQANEESLKNVVSKHAGKTLNVHTKKGSKTSQTVLYITLSDESVNLMINTVGKVIVSDKLMLQSLKMDVNTVGSIQMNIEGTDLTIKGKAIGSVELEGSVKKMHVDVLSVGSFKSTNLICNELDFNIGAITTAEIYAKEHLTLGVKACSLIKLKGEPTIVNDKNNPLIKIEKY